MDIVKVWLLLLFVGIAGSLLRPPPVAAATPVPSLTPAATAALWRTEVAQRSAHDQSLADLPCRTARVIFYDQTDWLRVATKLAQTQSSCAEYFISVPPLAADHTQPRSGQAGLIRALGPNFHALDEISYSGWSRWVSGGGGSWFDAGVAARERMTAAGFDIGAGDSWAMNELSSAVRRGTGSARRNALDFLHGLANDGVKGVVFTAGLSQSSPDLTQYKVALQDWLQDTGFWTEVAGYTSDWAQENYGDLRAYAVADTTAEQRRDAIGQYLTHEPALAASGPSAVAAAQVLLLQTYVPFGNAAWAWPSAYGWTAAPVEQMEDFVSGQIDADRTFAVSSGAASDRIGFAWSPRNSAGLTRAEFNAQTGSILDRIATAIRDSATADPDPGAAACAPDWCTTTLDGAVFTDTWQAFTAWSPALPVFLTAPVTATTGTAAGPVTVQLQTLGVPDNAMLPTTLTLSSTSPTAGFAPAETGPYSPALTLTVPAGSSTISFFFLDTTVGSSTLTVTLDGGAAADQAATIISSAEQPPADPVQSPGRGYTS